MTIRNGREKRESGKVEGSEESTVANDRAGGNETLKRKYVQLTEVSKK